MDSHVGLARSNRRIVFAVLTIAVASATLTATLTCDNEPAYHGHPLSSWVKTLSDRNCQDFGPDCTLDTAPDAILHIGTNGLPLLVNWLSYPGGPTPVRDSALWGMKICPALEKVPGLEDWAWFDTKDVRGEGAYVAFRILGPAGAPAIPSLLKVAKQPGESIPRYRAIEALGGIGQQSLTALLSIATNQIEYDMVRYSAAKNIGRFGIQARPAIPDLLNMLEDSDSNAAAGAAEALGNIPFEQAQISQVVPALAKASLQPGFMRQKMAILALGKLGPLASQAIPALLTASQEPNSFISITAKNSIAQIQPGACTDASTQ